MAIITISDTGGDWNDTLTWVEGVIPTYEDDVVATPTSGPLGTFSADGICKSINLENYTSHLDLSSGGIYVGDNVTGISGLNDIALKFSPTMTISCFSSNIIFNTLSLTVQEVDFAGLTTGDVVFGNYGGSGNWKLTGPHKTTPNNNVQFTDGELDTNSQDCTWGFFYSSVSSARTLTLGSSNIKIIGNILNAGSSVVGWETTTVTGLTITANTATVTLEKEFVCPNMVFNSGTKNFNGMSVVFKGTGTMITQCSGCTFLNFTYIGTESPTNRLQVNTGGFTITGTLTLQGFDSVNRLLVLSSIATPRILTVTGATLNLANINFLSMTFSPSRDISAIPGGSGNAGGNTGMTFTPSATKYFYTSTPGSKRWTNSKYWFYGSGGTGGQAYPPLPQDDSVFDSSSFAVPGANLIVDSPRVGRTINFTGVTNSPNVHFTRQSTNYGSLILDTGMTLTCVPAATFTMAGNGASSFFTLKSAGNILPWKSLTINMAGTNTLTFTDNYTGTGTITTTGLINTNDKNITVKAFSQTSGTLTMTTSTFFLTGFGTVWTSAGTIVRGTSLIKLTDNSTNIKLFAGGNKIYYNIELSGSSICTYNFTGSNTFNNFASSKTVAHKIQFLNATTTTVTNFSVNGTAGNMVNVGSSANSSHTITKSGGGTITCDYLRIYRSTASPVATWNTTNSINCGSATNWSGFVTDPFTWTGAVNNSWSTPGNWFGGAIPGVNNVAYFVSTYNIACTMDIPVNVKGIFMGVGYTSIITQAASITLGSEGWFQLASATFTGGSQSVTNSGDLIVRAGTHTPTTGVTTFTGSNEQYISLTSGYSNSSIVINKPTNNTIYLLTNLSMNVAGQTLHLMSGKLDLNGFNLTVASTITIDDKLRTTGTGITSGGLIISPSSSTVELFNSGEIILNDITSDFYNLILCENKFIYCYAEVLITIYGTISSTASHPTIDSGAASGQCVFRSGSTGGIKWFLNIVGNSTVGDTIDIQDCDARYGKWFEAPGSIYQIINACKTSGNYGTITSPAKYVNIFRNKLNLS